MKGPYSLDEWLRIYREHDSDTEYVSYPGELRVGDEEHGFFTYMFDAENLVLLIPKMCGDGRHWRKLIFTMVAATRHLGVIGVYCCTKRNPRAFMRLFGGTLVKQETKDNGQVLSYILITPENAGWRGGDSTCG
jgi:hypothetical protein